MKELILIDGNSLLFKAFYATAYTKNFMYNKDGIPTNGIFGFARMMHKILESSPEYVLVAFDAGKITFRNKLFDEYKATRKSTPEELIPQFSIVREYLDAHNITYYELEGYEGDDIIGTLAKFGESEDLKVSIYTGDKDAFQLVSDRTTIYRTVKGVTQLDIYTPETLKEKYDLKPDQIRDFLGLMGDSADNIPGIKGVGEKTALKLLHQYETIENLDKHKDEIKGKLGEKVRDGIQDAILSKEIATILKDVPIDVSLDKAKYDGYDYKVLKDFFLKYDMNSLVKVINDEQETEVKELKFDIVTEVPDITEESALYVSIYDENYHKSDILGFGVYNETQAFYISYEDALKDSKFLEYLSNPNKKKYGYQCKNAMIGCRWHNIEIKGYHFDLSLATYVLEPNTKDIFTSVCDYYHYEDIMYDEDVFGKGAKKHIPETEIIARHCVLNAKAIYTLKEKALKKLKAEDNYHLYEEIERPVSQILGEMEYTGAYVDRNVLKEMEKVFDDKIKTLENTIYEMTGEVFNISSPKQLGIILFEKLGLKSGKKTKTGYSTSQDILEKIEDQHPVISKVLEYRMLTKLTSTYIKGLQDQIFKEDHKIHTIYKQTLTQTGRLSSVDPNLQNIPVRTEEGKMIRKAFIAQHDYLVSFDYSQIELRILAHMAYVPSLIEAFNQGKDIHSHTAALVYNVKDEDVTPDMRRSAKAINFGIIYGMSEFRLSKDIGMTVKEAKQFIDKYFETYPEIQTYMDKVVEDCQINGYVSTLFNRKRYIPTINDRNYMVRQQAKRFAMNAPIQGSGADIMKMAMIKVDEEMKKHHFRSSMILQVHDELIFDVYKEELEELMSVVSKTMEECVSLKVPLKVDGYYAKDWCELK